MIRWVQSPVQRREGRPNQRGRNGWHEWFLPQRPLRLPAALAAGVALACRPAAAQTELIVNGGFETGTFAGWTLDNRSLGDPYDPDVPAAGGFVVDDNADTQTPLSGLPTLGPGGGTFFALSDMTAAGTHTLRQSFTVPLTAKTVTLSFDMYVYDWFGAGAAIDPSGLDHTTGGTGQPNQHARADLLPSSATAFDTEAGSVLQNFYLGVDPESAQDPPEAAVYRSYVFDLTGTVLPGQTYQLRFGTVDNQFVLNQAVDNVSVRVTFAPEPASGALLFVGAASGWLSARVGRLRRRRTAPSGRSRPAWVFRAKGG